MNATESLLLMQWDIKSKGIFSLFHSKQSLKQWFQSICSAAHNSNPLKPNDPHQILCRLHEVSTRDLTKMAHYPSGACEPRFKTTALKYTPLGLCKHKKAWKIGNCIKISSTICAALICCNALAILSSFGCVFKVTRFVKSA